MPLFQPAGADYGISSGGTVSMVLKSGTQAFHGGLWEFNRNDVFNAYNYFSKQSTPVPAKPELRLNIYGGMIGGPVWIPHVYNTHKEKTFFFVDEEWRKLVQGANPNSQSTVPAADFPTAGQPLHSVSEDAIVGPGLNNWNLSIYKEFLLTTHEGPRFQLRAETDNTFNHTQFNGVDTGTTDSNYGKVTSTYDPTRHASLTRNRSTHPINSPACLHLRGEPARRRPNLRAPRPSTRSRIKLPPSSCRCPRQLAEPRPSLREPASPPRPRRCGRSGPPRLAA